MNLTYIDCEMAQPSGKIIELGWCIANPVTNELIKTETRFIKCDEPITEYITNLTTITDELLAEKGIDLEDAVKDLIADHTRFCATSPMRYVVQWGAGDMYAIKGQVSKEMVKDLSIAFGRRDIDVKTIYQAYQMAHEVKVQSGLAKSMTKLGLKFKGTKHTAKDDAYNTFLIHHELLKRFKI